MIDVVQMEERSERNNPPGESWLIITPTVSYQYQLFEVSQVLSGTELITGSDRYCQIFILATDFP